MGLSSNANVREAETDSRDASPNSLRLVVNLNSEETQNKLAECICSWMSASAVTVEHIERLTGGAIQENWTLMAIVRHGDQQRQYEWVLRTDAPSGVASSLTRAQEFAVQQIAFEAGVRVPRPLWLCLDRHVIGRDFFIMERLHGVTSGRRLTREHELVPDRTALARELGENLARLHAVAPPRSGLEFLPVPSGNPALQSVALCREHLDALGIARPALEWGLRWCELNAPKQWTVCLIHRDYRTGNYFVRGGQLAGVLDWEFARWGDPREDLGWFTARCWRFAAPERAAGGIAEIEPFLDAYSGLVRRTITREELSYWQVLAHLRWAVVALQQAWRHISGQQRSLELSLTGRLVPELEYEVLNLIAGAPQTLACDPVPKLAARKEQGTAHCAAEKSSGEPEVHDLLATARELLLRKLLPALPEELRYEALMIANAMAISLREFDISEQAEQVEYYGLQRLLGNLPTEPIRRSLRLALVSEGNLRLQQAIKQGAFDTGAKGEALRSHLMEIARLRLAIGNPKRLAEDISR